MRLVGYVLFVAVLWFTGSALVDRLAKVEWADVSFDEIFLAGALGAAVLGRIAMGLICRQLTAALGLKVPTRSAIAAAWVSALGKYLPGKIGSVVSGVVILSRYNVRASASGLVFAILTGILVPTALVVALPLLLSAGVSDILPATRAWYLVFLGMGILALWPRFFLGLTNGLLRLRKRKPIILSLSWHKMILPVCFAFLQVFLTGLAAWFVLRSLTSVEILEVCDVVPVSALAGGIGLLALFAPAGLGVRDGIFLFGLKPIVGPEMAALATVCIRLLQTFVDVFMGAAGIWIVKS